MGLYLLVLVTLLGVASSYDQCPPQKELLPCTCDEEGVNCMRAKSVEDLKKAFGANFKYNATRSIWVQGTPITSLTADVFGKIKARSFFIEANDIAKVDLRAFRASKNYATSFSFFQNLIVDFPFSDLKDFKKLQKFNMGSNLIHSIPDNAFQSDSLSMIILYKNQIKYIGKNAFAKLPNLKTLDLSYNKLETIGPQAFATKAHGSQFLVTFENNRIVDIDDTAFDGMRPQVVNFNTNQLKTLKRNVFINLVESAMDQRGGIVVSNNPLTCRGCDYSWLVLNKYIIGDLLVGFRCVDGSVLEELTKPMIQCKI